MSSIGSDGKEEMKNEEQEEKKGLALSELKRGNTLPNWADANGWETGDPDALFAILERCCSRHLDVRTHGPDCGEFRVNCVHVLTRAEKYSAGFAAATLNGIAWTHGARVQKVKSLRVLLDGVALIDWSGLEWSRQRRRALLRRHLHIAGRKPTHCDTDMDEGDRSSSSSNKSKSGRSRSGLSDTSRPHHRRTKRRAATVDVLDFFDLPLPLSNESHTLEVICVPPEYLGAFYITSVDVHTIADRWSLRAIAQSHMDIWLDVVSADGRGALLHSVRDMVPIAATLAGHWPKLPFELTRLIASMYMQDTDVDTAAYVRVCTPSHRCASAPPRTGVETDETTSHATRPEDRRSLQWLFCDNCMICGVRPPGQPIVAHALYIGARKNEMWTGLVYCGACYRVVSLPLLERGWRCVQTDLANHSDHVWCTTRLHPFYGFEQPKVDRVCRETLTGVDNSIKRHSDPRGLLSRREARLQLWHELQRFLPHTVDDKKREADNVRERHLLANVCDRCRHPYGGCALCGEWYSFDTSGEETQEEGGGRSDKGVAFVSTHVRLSPSTRQGRQGFASLLLRLRLVCADSWMRRARHDASGHM